MSTFKAGFDDVRQAKPSRTKPSRRAVLTSVGAVLAATTLSTQRVAAQAASRTPGAPPQGEYIIDNIAIVSLDEAVGILQSGAIHIKDGVIVSIAARVDNPGVSRVDGTGRIAMPGMADTHWHMWNSLFKNMITPKRGYFSLKMALAPHHTPNDYYIANRLALAEALDTGITSVLNYAHNVRSPEHADAEIRAMTESGLRGRYAYGGRDPTPYNQIIDHADIRRIASQWFPNRGLNDTGRLGFAIAERAPGAEVKDDRRDEDYRLAFELGLPLVLHAGTSPVRHRLPSTIAAKGLANKDTLFVHGLMMTERDRRILIETGASLSLAIGPDYSTGRGAQARQLLIQMIQAGGNISLSCDASSLMPTSMFEQMRLASYLASPQVGTDTENTQTATPQQILAMSTRNALRGLAFGDVAGSLTPGKRADIVLLNARSLNMAPVGEELDRAILHSAMPHNVETVIVDGKILKWKGKVLSVDVERVRQQAIEALHDVRKRAGGEPMPNVNIVPPF